jgi:hypothetical protein
MPEPNGHKTSKWKKGDPPQGTVIQYSFIVPDVWMDALDLNDGLPRLMIKMRPDGSYTLNFWGIEEAKDCLDVYLRAGTMLANSLNEMGVTKELFHGNPVRSAEAPQARTAIQSDSTKTVRRRRPKAGNDDGNGADADPASATDEESVRGKPDGDGGNEV